MADISRGFGIGVLVGVIVGVDVWVEVGVRDGVAVDDGTTVGLGGGAGSVSMQDVINIHMIVSINQ